MEVEVRSSKCQVTCTRRPSLSHLVRATLSDFSLPSNTPVLRLSALKPEKAWTAVKLKSYDTAGTKGSGWAVTCLFENTVLFGTSLVIGRSPLLERSNIHLWSTGSAWTAFQISDRQTSTDSQRPCHRWSENMFLSFPPSLANIKLTFCGIRVSHSPTHIKLCSDGTQSPETVHVSVR